MNADAGDDIGAADTPASSANISGSNFGHNTCIHQGMINIFLRNIFLENLRNSASSHTNNSSGVVQAQLEEKEQIDCRRSLGFRDIDARLQNISPVHPGTCDWVFKTPLFRKWYNRDERKGGLLWIKGKPGTGKSTLMKRILEYCQTKKDYLIAAYFFNARGAELEQTPLGMLRSLLFQLLEHEPILYDQLLPMFRKKQQDYRSDDWEWREPELTSYFLSEIPKCQSKPLLLIIDALDECSEHDVQKVVEFLEHLSNNAIGAGTALNICLSSRHYPFVRFKRYRELVLENEQQHDRDIINYISAKLTQRDKAIEKAIREKSSGIFMWVVLVITMLNKAYEDGKIEAMKQKLDETPAELGDVFETLLSSSNPNKDETVLIMQWVLFAKRPLTPEELYFALIAGTNSQRLGKWDPKHITPDIVRRRIISSSRGLVEIRRGGNKRVQFIHKSVNDFLVRNNRLQSLDPGLTPNPIAKCHERLKDCCTSYLMMKSLKLSGDNANISAYQYPFLEYAAHYVLDHAEESTLVGQTELLLTLKDDSIFKHVARFYEGLKYMDPWVKDFNLLQILAARGLPKLIVILLEQGADINAQERPLGTALEVAVYHEQEKAVEILLKRGAKIDIRENLTDSSLLQRAFDGRNRQILAMLIDRGAKFNIRERLKGSLLHRAIETGDKDIIAMVLSKRAKINARGLYGTALLEAARDGDKEIIEMLLDKGAKINARGLYGTALMAAAGDGDKEMVEMLLERGAKINARGLFGTALMAAARDGGNEMVEMLLERGAKINARGLYGTALMAAARDGDKEMVEMLLERGAKINARGLFGTALITAVVSGDRETVEILIEKGANINARAPMGYLVLENWDVGGREKILEKCLDFAKAMVRQKPYGTALHAAVAHGREEIADLLRAKGAKV